MPLKDSEGIAPGDRGLKLARTTKREYGFADDEVIQEFHIN